MDGYTSSNEILDKPFDVSEVVGAMKHLKAGKAAGDDNIKNDFILCDQNNLKNVTHCCLTSCMKQVHF